MCMKICASTCGELKLNFLFLNHPDCHCLLLFVWVAQALKSYWHTDNITIIISLPVTDARFMGDIRCVRNRATAKKWTYEVIYLLRKRKISGYYKINLSTHWLYDLPQDIHDKLMHSFQNRYIYRLKTMYSFHAQIELPHPPQPRPNPPHYMINWCNFFFFPKTVRFVPL